MNILSFCDAEKYLKNQQVYFKKDIINVDMKTIAKSNKVYNIGEVDIKRINEDMIAFWIVINGIETTMYEYKRDIEFFAWIRVNFIPVSELIKFYNSN